MRERASGGKIPDVSLQDGSGKGQIKGGTDTTSKSPPTAARVDALLFKGADLLGKSQAMPDTGAPPPGFGFSKGASSRLRARLMTWALFCTLLH